MLQGPKYKGQVCGFHTGKHGRLGDIPNVSDAGIIKCQEYQADTVTYKLFDGFCRNGSPLRQELGSATIPDHTLTGQAPSVA